MKKAVVQRGTTREREREKKYICLFLVTHLTLLQGLPTTRMNATRSVSVISLGIAASYLDLWYITKNNLCVILCVYVCSHLSMVCIEFTWPCCCKFRKLGSNVIVFTYEVPTPRRCLAAAAATDLRGEGHERDSLFEPALATMKQRAKMHVEEPHCASYSKYSDEEEEQVQMLRVRAPEHCIEAQVQDGDTLQAIALRFHCSISELKRINHIDKDNEIFARRTIKVPVTPYSVLTQVLPGAPEPVPSTSNGITHEKPNQAPGDHIVDTILNSSIAPAVIPYTDGDSQETVEENTLLIQPPKRESVNEVIVKELTSHGADFGMKWFHLLSFVLVLGVAAPIIYVLFFLNKHHDVHSLHMVSQPPH